MKKYNNKIKLLAKQLRNQGKSYSELTKILKVPRSTLHQWLFDPKFSQFYSKEGKFIHLKNIQKLGANAVKLGRETRLKQIKDKVEEEILKYETENQYNLKIFLSLLYWAEGSKTRGQVVFTNTDPKMALLFITLLRKCFDIDEKKLRIRLHLHYYHDVKKIKKYWSDLLKVNENQFNNIYLKARSKSKKFRKNFAGICFIKYYSEALREEILQRAYLFANKINNFSVPVA